jgi:integrase
VITRNATRALSSTLAMEYPTAKPAPRARTAADSIAWLDFRTRYEREAFPSVSADTRKHSRSVFDDIWRVLAPATLADVASRRGEFGSVLRHLGHAPDTVRQKLSRLNGMLRWAERNGMATGPGRRLAASSVLEQESCAPIATWQEFRQGYERGVLAFLAPATQLDARSTFDEIERLIAPRHPADLTPQLISLFQARLRELGNADATVHKKFRRIRAALKWAARMGIIKAAPEIVAAKRQRRSKVMKGRPITEEEFDRMLAAAAEVVERERVLSWRHYLRGLFTSGLRLAESLELQWDGGELCIDLSGSRPLLRIPADHDKSREDRLLPMAPEFAEFLLATPDRDRSGHVFRPKARRVVNGRPLPGSVSKTVCAIGKAAGVIVGKGRGGKPKFASAHDLRRSFGERWSDRVMPQVLCELMRHESIDETTMKYYVGKNAQRTAEILWDAHAAAGKLASERSAV